MVLWLTIESYLGIGALPVPLYSMLLTSSEACP